MNFYTEAKKKYFDDVCKKNIIMHSLNKYIIEKFPNTSSIINIFEYNTGSHKIEINLIDPRLPSLSTRLYNTHYVVIEICINDTIFDMTTSITARICRSTQRDIHADIVYLYHQSDMLKIYTLVDSHIESLRKLERKNKITTKVNQVESISLLSKIEDCIPAAEIDQLNIRKSVNADYYTLKNKTVPYDKFNFRITKIKQYKTPTFNLNLRVEKLNEEEMLKFTKDLFESMKLLGYNKKDNKKDNKKG